MKSKETRNVDSARETHAGEDARVADNEGSRKKKRSAATDADPAIPDKLYFRIGEVARLLSIAPYVLRFWESEFPQLHPNKGGTGQRLYRRRDVETALRIKRLLYQQGYTIPGARQLLKAELREPEPPPVQPVEMQGESAQARLQRVRSELKEIASMLASPAGGRQAASGKATPSQAARRGLHIAPGSRKTTPEAPVLLFPEDPNED